MYDYKLLKASDIPYVFKSGDIVHVKRGGNTVYEMKFYNSPASSTMSIYDMKGDTVYSTPYTNMNSISVRGIVWTLLRGAALFLRVNLCPNGVVATPEEDVPDYDDIGEYIIWCPSSNRPPRVVLDGSRKAKEVAISMSERHNSTFHWCKLVGKAEQVTSRTTKVTE